MVKIRANFVPSIICPLVVYGSKPDVRAHHRAHENIERASNASKFS